MATTTHLMDLATLWLMPSLHLLGLEEMLILTKMKPSLTDQIPVSCLVRLKVPGHQLSWKLWCNNMLAFD